MTDWRTSRNVPHKYRRVRESELVDTEAMQHTRAWLDGDRPWLVLSGGVGSGKSLAASWAVLGTCPDRYDGPTSGVSISRFDGWPVAMYPRFVATYELARLSAWDDDWPVLERCSILAIDDLGIEHVGRSEALLAAIGALLDARYARELRTVITTNLGKPEFRERYGERTWSRLRELGMWGACGSEDLRGRARPVVPERPEDVAEESARPIEAAKLSELTAGLLESMRRAP